VIVKVSLFFGIETLDKYSKSIQDKILN